MARIKGATMTRKRRNKVLKLAKGYYGSKHSLFKTAKQAVMNHGGEMGSNPIWIVLEK